MRTPRCTDPVPPPGGRRRVKQHTMERRGTDLRHNITTGGYDECWIDVCVAPVGDGICGFEKRRLYRPMPAALENPTDGQACPDHAAHVDAVASFWAIWGHEEARMGRA